MHGHRENGAGCVESDGSPARLRENQDWLRQNEQPWAHHPSGDVDEGFAGVENKSAGNEHTVIDRGC